MEPRGTPHELVLSQGRLYGPSEPLEFHFPLGVYKRLSRPAGLYWYTDLAFQIVTASGHYSLCKAPVVRIDTHHHSRQMWLPKAPHLKHKAHAAPSGWLYLLSPILPSSCVLPQNQPWVRGGLSILWSTPVLASENGAAFLFTDAGVGGTQPRSLDNGQNRAQAWLGH